jgi:hypothetical protein
VLFEHRFEATPNETPAIISNYSYRNRVVVVSH